LECLALLLPQHQFFPVPPRLAPLDRPHPLPDHLHHPPRHHHSLDPLSPQEIPQIHPQI